MVLTGGPGAGKSRAAETVGRAYLEMGVMSKGHVIEVPAADLGGTCLGRPGS
jgi:putative protein kinase ArgK-like GTPase of G3E family